jgi:hypothetical protein
MGRQEKMKKYNLQINLRLIIGNLLKVLWVEIKIRGLKIAEILGASTSPLKVVNSSFSISNKFSS